MTGRGSTVGRAVPGGPARLVGAGLVLAGVTAGVLAVCVPSLGLLYGVDPSGPVVTAGLPLARMLALGAAAAGIGQLLVAAVLVPGAPGDVVSASGWTAVRAVRWCAGVQALAAVAVAVGTVLENTGLPPGRLLPARSALLVGLHEIEPAAGWLVTAALAVPLAVAAGWVLTWRASVGLLLYALVVPLPATLTAATDAQRSHDIAGDALALHVSGALIWLGSASAVAAHLTRGGPRAAVVLRRHGVLAGWCLVVVAASGTVSAAYALPPRALLSSGFGWLVTISAVLLVGAWWLGAMMRSALAGSRAGVARAAGLVAGEVALLGVAAALGSALTRLVPPAEVGYETSRLMYLIGYDLPARFTPLDLVWRWRPDLVFGPAAVLGAAAYLLGVRRLRRAGVSWPVRYRTAWLAGCAVLLVATSSGLGSYAPAMFSIHMVQHMLLATVVPVLLVLGHAAGLTLTGCRARTAARWRALLDSPLVGFLSHPLVAWLAVGSTLFGLYSTGLYAALAQEHWAHLAMNVAVLGTGLALFWSVLGTSRGRSALPPIGQLVMIFAVMALHAAFAAWLLGRATPVAAGFYTSVRLPFVPDLLADQRLGAVLAWVLGEAPVILAVLALVLRWTRDDRDPLSAEPGWRRPHEPVPAPPRPLQRADQRSP